MQEFNWDSGNQAPNNENGQPNHERPGYENDRQGENGDRQENPNGNYGAPRSRESESGYFNHGTPGGKGNIYEYGEPPKQTGNGLAIAALVCGILGICCCGIPLGLAAIICAVIDRKNRGSFSGMGIAGLICGIFSVVSAVISLVIIPVILKEFEDIIASMESGQLLSLFPRLF